MLCRGANLFPAFMEYIKTTDKADEDKKREALLAELKSIDADLKKTEGPYVGGQDVNAADLKLGPQLKHVIIGAKAVKARSLLLLSGLNLPSNSPCDFICKVKQNTLDLSMVWSLLPRELPIHSLYLLELGCQLNRRA